MTTCTRCKQPLDTKQVRKEIWVVRHIGRSTIQETQVEWVEEPADCVRCTGGY